MLFVGITGAGDSGSARPPKKRLANMTMPSLEELRRDSMNFRKKVISQFNDDTAKPKKKEKSKREKGKHKKKKEKVKDKEKDKDKEKKHKVKIVSNEANSSKLIIRFARSKQPDTNNTTNDSADEASTSSATSYSINPSSSCSSPPHITAPIRLKIARSSLGGSYVAESTSSSITAAIKEPVAPKDVDLTKCQVVLTDFTKTNDLKSNDADNMLAQRQQTAVEQSLNGKI